MKKLLDNVTLLGVDCVDIDRLLLASEICQKDFEFAEIKLLSSIKSVHKDVVLIDPIKSVQEYSKFIISDLDKYVDTPFVLIIQYDGFVLNSSAWSEEYLNYDYIGAPWLIRKYHVNMGWPTELLGKYVVGCGGFSLRSKKLTSLCADLAKKNFFEKYDPEDAVLCVDNRKYFEDNGIKFAPVDLAKRFCYSAEDIENYSWNDQLGFHGLWYTDISKWTKNHPEYKIDNTLKAAGKKHKY